MCFPPFIFNALVAITLIIPIFHQCPVNVHTFSPPIFWSYFTIMSDYIMSLIKSMKLIYYEKSVQSSQHISDNKCTVLEYSELVELLKHHLDVVYKQTYSEVLKCMLDKVLLEA